MPAGVSFYEALRYLYPENIIPLCEIEYVESYDPYLVAYVPGAIGFEFIKIVEVESPDGEISRHVLNRNDYYYWGQHVSIAELSDNPYYLRIESTGYEEFCLLDSGALIGLDEEDSVIPYPRFLELPSDMRME
jgi:hypothetical protein